MWYFASKVRDTLRNLGWFFKNGFLFRKILWEFRPYDHAYCVQLYKFGLQQLANDIENGPEERHSANKKIEKIKSLISLLDDYDNVDDVFDIHLADYQKNGLSNEQYWQDIEKAESLYAEKVFGLIKGQEPESLRQKQMELLDKITNDEAAKSEFIDKYNLAQSANKETDIHYYASVDVFDGSGCRNWWT